MDTREQSTQPVVNPINLRIPLLEFKSIEDALNNEQVKNSIKDEINKLISSRINRPSAPAGMHYKRDIIDVMIDEYELTLSFMLEHFADVYNKVSNIPGTRRNVMSHVCMNAIAIVLKANTVIVKEKDKFHVNGSRAKLSVIKIDTKDKSITVRLNKIDETWLINDFVKSLLDKTLIYHGN